MSNRLLFKGSVRLASAQALARQRGASWEAIRAAWRRYQSRRRIAQLDSRMLKDVGISFAEAEAEANKPFWRA